MENNYAAIDYAAVRELIPLGRVLELLNFEPTRVRGVQLRGGCLLSNCESSDFSANVERNIWYCFGCRRGGNQLDLWRGVQGGSLYDSTEHLCQVAHVAVPRIGPPIPSAPRPATDQLVLFTPEKRPTFSPEPTLRSF